MRKLLSFVLLFFVSISLFAADGEPNLIIKAYKIDRTGDTAITEFVVTDALTSSDMLERVENGRPLVLDDFLERFFGTIGDAAPTLSSEAFSEHILYSIRVAGKGNGNYTVTSTFHPFLNESKQNSGIKIACEVGNVNCIFEGVGTSEKGGAKIESDIDHPKSVIDSQEGSCVFSWDVIDATGNDYWTVRSAVAFTIDESSYDTASYGKHTAEITVKLEAI